MTVFGSILAAVYTAPERAGRSAEEIDQAMANAQAAGGSRQEQLTLAVRDAFDLSFTTVVGVALVMLVLGAGLVAAMTARRG